jgi:hypothetical protein
MPAKARQGRRLALIIAGSTYSDPTLQKLRAPGKDASDLAGVLGDPAIGGFEVDTLVDAPAERVKSGIFDFCEQARPGDLLMLYLSCHGVLDDRGRLYYAATDTQSRRLGLTGIASEWLNDQLEDCKARREILILDCCHSGAFAKGTKGASALALKEKFGGRGKAVLTASRATEYSFEGTTTVGDDVRSIFTNAIVQGLRSGEADRDQDGLVTLEDLYHYVYEVVRQAEPRQTPEWWVTNGEGEFVVAHSVRGAIIAPVPLSKHVTEILESPHAEVRESGVKVLARLLEQGAPERGPTARQNGLAQSARQRLQQIVQEDLPRIAAQAQTALSAGSAEATADPKPAPQAGTENPGESPKMGATEQSTEPDATEQSTEPDATKQSTEPQTTRPITENPPTSQPSEPSEPSQPSQPSQPSEPSEPGNQPSQPGSQQATDLTYDTDYFPALDAYFAGHWEEAVGLWSALASRYPGEEVVASKLAGARQGKDLEDWYGKADAAEQHADWGQVVAALEKVVSIDPTFREATTRLGTAKGEKKRQRDADLAARPPAGPRPPRHSGLAPQPGAPAADHRNPDSTAYKPGDTVRGQVLGADYVWHPLAQTGPPPRGYLKGFFRRLWWMYLLSVIAAVVISAWTILSDYQNGTLAATEIQGVAPSYLRQSAIMAAIVAVLVDFMVAALQDRKQRKRQARTMS